MSELLRGQKQAPRPAGNGDSRAREDSAGDGMSVIERDPPPDPPDKLELWFVPGLPSPWVTEPFGRDKLPVEYVRADLHRGAVSPEITDAELDAAWAAWMEHWVTEDGRTAMRSALVAFLSTRGGQ